MGNVPAKNPWAYLTWGPGGPGVFGGPSLSEAKLVFRREFQSKHGGREAPMWRAQLLGGNCSGNWKKYGKHMFK